MTCERPGCGRSPAYLSIRLGQRVCSPCYHESFAPEGLAVVGGIERQRLLAQAIRGAADLVDGRRTQRLHDRALLIELADREQDVIVLIDEVRELGVRLEVRR